MSTTEPITLVVVSDDHYMMLLAALIKSIEKNLSPGAKIDLWVIEDRVKKENAERLNASVNPEITTIYRRKLLEVVNKAQLPKDRTSYPMNIYARLFIPYFIPAQTEKALYMDVDMIVLTDLLDLWNTDIADYTIAAVTDPRVQTFANSWGGILNYEELGLRGDSKYFNSGLLLMNLKKWRADNVTGQILNAVSQNIKYANYPDQYGMNVVLGGKWLELDGRWNHFADLPCAAPFIIHFVERKPIYSAYKNSDIYRGYFFQYLDSTPWKNFKPISETRRAIKKIKNILHKLVANEQR